MILEETRQEEEEEDWVNDRKKKGLTYTRAFVLQLSYGRSQTERKTNSETDVRDTLVVVHSR